MKNISPELEAHLAGSLITIATCWKVTRTDDFVLAATDHDQDLVVDAITYLSSSGYVATNVETASSMDNGTGELTGFLSSPSITEDDLRAGLWDFAQVERFQVNWADLTMGKLILQNGNLGEVTIERGQFKAELRGKINAYKTVIGRLITPSCPWILGDSNCTKDLSAFTFTGVIEGVNPDGVTLYDSARTETGPTGGIAITGITNANPGVVTMASAGTFFNGQAVTLSGIVGPDALNQTTVIRNLSGSTFDLGIDTSDTLVYPAYVSGGLVTPMGEESGYFDHGKITFTSGLNSGLSMDIKSSLPGQITLFLPMPNAVQVGDAYTIVAGCDKSIETCKATFDNVVNFGGFPYLPGIDKIVQVGRQNT